MPSVILLYALFASLFTIQKETLFYSEPLFLVGSRMLFAGLLLLIYMLITSRKVINIKVEHIGSFIMLGLFNIYLTNIFEICGINHMVSAKACLIYSLSPFLAALGAFCVLREVLTKRKWLGMIIGFFGLIPIHFTQTYEEIKFGQCAFFSIAELSILGAVFCSVYGWILLKKIISEYKYSTVTANAFSMILGGIVILGHSYLAGELWQPIPVIEFKPFIIYSLFMCLISNIICYNLYGYLLKRFTATFMSFSGLVTSLFASLFGYFFLGETITWHFVISICMFSLGLALFYKDEIKYCKSHRFQTTINSNISVIK